MNEWLAPRRAATLACALMLGGAASAPPLATDQCRLALTSRFIGASAVPAVRSAIGVIARPLALRWIAPGVTIKTDFNARRLNVILDETGRIMAMRCG
ncbi:MAG: I78 family peptidase inhibitor [Novosphingobium sp.]